MPFVENLSFENSKLILNAQRNNPADLITVYSGIFSSRLRMK